MYTATYNKNGTLKHSNECKMAFGKKDSQCLRCVEMINGAAPRSGWQKSYFEMKAQNDFMHEQQRQKHNQTCKICTGQVRGICTFGES